MSFHFPEKYRLRKGYLASDASAGNNGAGFIPVPRSVSLDNRAPLKFIASDGEGWEHVSVSLPHRCPTWEEVCMVKSLFWDDEDAVMQLHPPRSTWVNNHSFCLHLWRPIDATVPLPPEWMVGYRELGTLA